MKLMLFSFLFQMLGLSYFYGGFLVGPQVNSCHVITQTGNLIVKGLYLHCEPSLFPSDLGVHELAGMERRGTRNEVSPPSRTFSHMRGHLLGLAFCWMD